jgi:predicted membrane channel-forming protein YqfA (hemolysin III family)
VKKKNIWFHVAAFLLSFSIALVLNFIIKPHNQGQILIISMFSAIVFMIFFVYKGEDENV